MLSHPQIPSAYFWCDFHMQTSKAAWLSLQYRQREYHLCPLPWPSLPQDHVSAYFLPCPIFSLKCLQSVSNTAQTKCLLDASPDTLAALTSCTLPYFFCDYLSTLETLGRIWKKTWSASHTHVDFSLHCAQVQLHALQPLISFNQKKEVGWGRRIWTDFHAYSTS